MKESASISKDIIALVKEWEPILTKLPDEIISQRRNKQNRTIKQIGITEYLQQESVKWTCLKCGSALCVHRDKCIVCEGN